jgi:predicted transcriptional regulator of viral defense system
LVADLAERQHGVVARRQLLGLGMSSSAIDRQIQAGLLHRIHLGVYAVGHSLVSWRGKLMAGVLYGGEGAVVSHLPAAALWDLLPTASAAVHITVPRRSGRGRPGVNIHQTRRLDPAATGEVDAIP